MFLTQSSGKHVFGGFPNAEIILLHEYLHSQGFTPSHAVATPDIAQNQEHFRGSYQGSHPFLVTISTRTNSVYGVEVAMQFAFRGLRWSVHASAEKAGEFADTLHRWLSGHTTLKMQAKKS